MLLRPFRYIARLLFSDVKLKRDGKNLHLRVEAKPDTGPQALREKAVAEAAPLKAALTALLDSHRMSRQVLRHLGYLERALATKGLQAMAEVPVDVLAISLRQLDDIVSNWANGPLADLRSKVAVAVVDRSADPFFGPAGQRLSNFATESRLEVADVSHSMFMELERQYEGLIAQETIQASLDAAKAAA